jgi:Cu-Zn family superoxide dismutase
MTKLLVAALALLAAAPLAGAATDGARTHVLPGAAAFPESIGVDPRTGQFFTGSLIDGTVYRGTLDAPEATVFLPAGSDGRTNVAGVKVDDHGRVWVADAFNGRVLVYGEDGRLLHAFTLAGPGTPTVNDMAFARGVAYVTDSSRPFLYRIPMGEADASGTTVIQPWLDVTPTVTYSTGEGPFGVNLNGIVTSPDGRTLIIVQTNTGDLFRVDVMTGAITRVAVSGAGLLFGDGLLRLGNELLVARNAANEIVGLTLGPGWRSAVATSTLTRDDFAFPTALAAVRGRLLVTNSQLNAGSSPMLPFTVLDLPVSETQG